MMRKPLATMILMMMMEGREITWLITAPTFNYLSVNLLMTAAAGIKIQLSGDGKDRHKWQLNGIFSSETKRQPPTTTRKMFFSCRTQISRNFCLKGREREAGGRKRGRGRLWGCLVVRLMLERTTPASRNEYLMPVPGNKLKALGKSLLHTLWR